MFTVGTRSQNLIVISYANLKSTQTAKRPKQRNINTKLSDATIWAQSKIPLRCPLDAPK